MSEPIWVDIDVVLAIHQAQLTEHGGSSGIKDQSLLEAALARPKNVYSYEAGVTLNRLASAYAIGLAKNHAFVDGNKRVAWVVCALFVRRNGGSMYADPAVVVKMMLGVADGTITMDIFGSWLDKENPQGAAPLR